MKEHYRAFGKEKERDKLKNEYPNDYELISKVVDIKKGHLKKNGIPLQYIFQLVCYYEKSCPHPLCQLGQPDNEPVWYGGPPTFIPLPVPDKDRPYGSKNCTSCPLGKCAGHFLAASKALKLYQSGDPGYKPQSVPPNEVIRIFYNKFGNMAEESKVGKLADETILSTSEVYFTIYFYML